MLVLNLNGKLKSKFGGNVDIVHYFAVFFRVSCAVSTQTTEFATKEIGTNIPLSAECEVSINNVFYINGYFVVS